MKGLLGIVSESLRHESSVYLRPVELRYLLKTIDYCICTWPLQVRRVVDGSLLNVIGSVLEDEIRISLP